MKTCFRCQRELPLCDFYTHPRMRDGHLNKCKDCTRMDTAKRHERLSRDPEWFEAECERHRLKARRYRENGKEKPPSPEKKRETLRRYRERFPEKERAKQAVNRAIRNGSLVPQPCEVCGSKKVHAHHDEYSKPLDVKWLCPKDHASRHVQLRRKERLKQIH